MDPAPSDSSESRARHSGVYREFLAERAEILRHKWLRSESKGRDIGFDNALTDWVASHRSSWRRSRHGGA